MNAESQESGWNIPPPDKAGRISFITRLIARSHNWPVWVARLSEPREQELLGIMQETCQQMGIRKIPRLILYADEKPNASSVLLSGEVMFSTNLLDILPRDEVKAVMAHELTHHAHRPRDLAIQGGNIALTEAGMYAGYHVLNRWQPRRSIGNAFKFLAMTEIVGDIAGLIGFGVIQNWFQRRSEKEADLGGARVAGTRSMVDMLLKLDDREEEIRQEREGEKKFDWRKYTVDLPIFRSHPSTEDRIKNILAHAPKQSFTEQYEAEEQLQQPLGHK